MHGLCDLVVVAILQECCMTSADIVVKPKYWDIKAFANSIDPD